MRSRNGFPLLELIICVAVLAMFGAVLSTCWDGCAGEKRLCLKGADDCHVFEPYGWLDVDNVKNEDIEYEVSTGNVVLSVIFFQTVWVPVVLIGYSLYEPVEVKSTNPGKPKGAK